MSGETLKKLGAVGKKDAPELRPQDVTIIGRDISADALKALYPDAGGVHLVIDALVDARSETDPPAEFIATLKGGVRVPILVRDLGPDCNGTRWKAVINGRKRTLGLRAINKDREAEGLPPYVILAIAQTFALNPDGAVLARQIKAVTNVHVESTPMQRALLAAEFRESGISLENTAVMLGVTSEQAVRDILSLVDCSPAVQAALVAGTIKQSVAKKLAKLEHAAQDEKLAKLNGKKGRAAQAALAESGSAVVRMQRKPHLEGVARMLACLRVEPKRPAEEIAAVEAIMQYTLGDDGALAKCPGYFRLAVERAREEAGRDKRRKTEEKGEDQSEEQEEAA